MGRTSSASLTRAPQKQQVTVLPRGLTGSCHEDGSVPDEVEVESDARFQLLRLGTMAAMRTPVRHPGPHVRLTPEVLSRMEQEAAAHLEEVSIYSPQKGQKKGGALASGLPRKDVNDVQGDSCDRRGR